MSCNGKQLVYDPGRPTAVLTRDPTPGRRPHTAGSSVYEMRRSSMLGEGRLRVRVRMVNYMCVVL
jgi:hypothetical protein